MAKRPTLSMYTNMGPADFRKMSEPELKMAIRVMSDVANKRIKRLQGAGLEGSPALSASETHYGIPKGDQSKQSLMNAAAAVHHFLSYESSTVTGRKAQISRAGERFRQEFGEDWTPSQRAAFWEGYQRFKNRYPNTAESLQSSQETARKYMAASQEWKNMSKQKKEWYKERGVKSRMAFINNRMIEMYEEEQQELQGIDVFDQSDYVEMRYVPTKRNTVRNTKRTTQKKKKN